MAVRAFIQARMSSARFPGKVLAPFRGRPMIAHVLDRIADAVGRDALVVATSTEPTDDPLSCYVAHLGVTLFRGPLDDVFERLRLCAAANPCEWILRVSADSPLIDPGLVRRVVDAGHGEACDVVTTIHPRTFPKGQNAELIRTATLMAVDGAALSGHEREHVTPYFYRHDDRFRIRRIASGQPALADLNFAVDTLADLTRLEQIAGTPDLTGSIEVLS